MLRKNRWLFLLLGFFLMSCTVGIVREGDLAASSASATPEGGPEATLVALQTQNAYLATRVRQLEPTPTAAWTLTPTPTSTSTSSPPSERRVVVTATPTPTPSTPTPTPLSCSLAWGAAFAFSPELLQFLSSSLGCPASQPETLWTAEQTFEGGSMFWREDRDDAFILFASSGSLYITSDTYAEGDPDDACPELGSAPNGYVKPVRGFNRQWCNNAYVRDRLGWAVGEELGYDTQWQEGERGFVVKDSAGNFVLLIVGEGYQIYVTP